jgi:hypothetical protein
LIVLLVPDQTPLHGPDLTGVRVRNRRLPGRVSISARGLVTAALAVALGTGPARAQGGEVEPGTRGESPPDRIAGIPYVAGFQATVVGQNLFPFHSPYRGPNSLPSKGEFSETEVYTFLVGVRPANASEVYTNWEIARGAGLASGTGLGGYVDGRFVPPGAYVARAFGRWTVRTGPGSEPEPTGDNRIPGIVPSNRLVVTAGKFSTNDYFDVNRYSADARTEFLNFSLDNSTAWDFAQDFRGYTRGLIAEWIHPNWALRAGSVQVPTTASGPVLADDLLHNRGDQVEGELHAHLLGKRRDPAVLRLLGFSNMARMGNFEQAVRLARATGTVPDVTRTRREGRVTYGASFNFEQPLADGGETGIFGRLAWNNGQNESWGYTECDRTASLGAQISGARWRRPNDHLGIGWAANALSAAHRNYLAVGGHGFVLGDGALNYGLEQIAEIYYAYQVRKFVTFSLDYQLVANPGYNRDRGPAHVISARTFVSF